MKPFLVLSLSTLVGCTVGTTLPFGGGTSYYPRPISGAPVAQQPGEAGPVGDTGESIPAPADRGGRIACVRDAAGASFANATPLAKGTVGGCLDTTDTDVYTLTAGPNAGGTIFGIKLHSKESTCGQLFDQDKKYITHSECTWAKHTEYLWAAVAPNTTVYFKMERQNQVVSPYRLEVTETLIADDEEPNNSWRAATPLAIGTPHSALLGDVVNDKGNTRDFYKVVLAKPQQLSIVIDPAADDVRPKVTIYDADRRELASEYADNEGAILRESRELRAGTYYLEVEEYGWGIGYGNGPAGSDSTGAEHPSGHYSKPYTIELTAGESSKRRRVSKR